ncbi:MAG: peptide deformylase [Chloroflexota bacterium]
MEWPVRLRIEQAGAPTLHAPARDVSAKELARGAVQDLIEMMFATLHGVGVGLAAPQIGVPLRLVVVEDPPEAHALVDPDLLSAQERVAVAPHVLVNPVLSVDDPEQAEFFEGCLSVDGYRAIVPRARSVRVRALDRDGQPIERVAVGWYARILQHEVDHLDGRLYIERMLPRTFVTAQHARTFAK